MNKPKILLIVPLYFANLPRNIRAQNIIKHLADTYECHVLCFDMPINYDIAAGAYIHKIPLSPFSKFVLHRGFFPDLSIAWPILIILKGLNFLLMRYVLFPDNLTPEIRRLSRKLRALDSEFNFDRIVLSVIPFSLLKLLKDEKIREKAISDVGDPLLDGTPFRSPDNYEREYLALTPHMIVTNENTKTHYIKKLGFPAKSISVVRQGYDDNIFFNEGSCSDFEFEELKLILSGALYGRGLRDPDPFLRAAEAFSRTASIRISYYGTSLRPGPSLARIVTVSPPVNQLELSKAYRKHNLLVFIDNNNALQTPGKIYELLAMKIPILYLYTVETETMKTLEDASGVFFVKNEYGEIFAFFQSLINKTYSFDFSEWSESASWENRAAEFRRVLETH